MIIGRATARPTRLALFLQLHGIPAAALADRAGISREHLRRLRFDLAEPTRPMMVWIAEACSYLVHRRVAVDELFELSVEINEDLL